MKVCGRSELQKLLTMRHKFQAHRKPKEPKDENAEPKAPKEKLDSDEELDRELDKAVKRIE